ncbi:MAG: response regulator transcription factor [bacterium]|nr:response regulator transcription factor [bacterium]
MSIRVVLADDHRLLLEGLAQAISGIPDLEVVGTAEDGDELIQLVELTQPDVMLVDVEMPNTSGIAALGQLTDGPPAIMVTMHADAEHRAKAEAVGAVGFLSKSTPLPVLAAAIRAVAAGESLMGDDLEQVLDSHREPVLTPGAASLTPREKELLATLASGISSTDDLANELFISQKTVKNHLASIYEKLGITDRAQAAVEAIRLGLHRPSPEPDRSDS